MSWGRRQAYLRTDFRYAMMNLGGSGYGGLVVNVLAFYYDHPSSNPVEASSLFSKLFLPVYLQF